jgi:hypothetical protein
MRAQQILDVYILFGPIFQETLAGTAQDEAFMIANQFAHVFHFFDLIIIAFKNRTKREWTLRI